MRALATAVLRAAAFFAGFFVVFRTTLFFAVLVPVGVFFRGAVFFAGFFVVFRATRFFVVFALVGVFFRGAAFFVALFFFTVFPAALFLFVVFALLGAFFRDTAFFVAFRAVFRMALFWGVALRAMVFFLGFFLVILIPYFGRFPFFRRAFLQHYIPCVQVDVRRTLLRS